MSDLARSVRTIRHLRPSQIYWRLRYRRESARPAVAAPPPAALTVRDDFPASAIALSGADEVGRESLGEQCHGKDARATECRAADEAFVDQLEHGWFTHLNESRDLGTEVIDWLLGRRETDRLWTITLHYHAWAWRLARLVRRGEELGARADRLLRRYLGDWIASCDLTVAGSRPMAWNAYAIATRIGWWCQLYHLLGNEARATWGTLEPLFLESLWNQASYLGNHLEWDLRANHLLRDVVGLAWAGRFFDGTRPRRWLRTAAHLAVQQAVEQVLPDGGHFERSPMYHVAVMGDLLTLAVLLERENDNARRQLAETWRHMAEWLAWVRHPDGRVPLLNDGGLNGACPPAAVFAAGRQYLGVEVDRQRPVGGRMFPDFGLAVWHGRPWSIFFDVGPVGVDYQPGHAHADTLSIEASYEGRRVFVDPGTLRYDNDASRRYDRATASHNTVAIDGADSSEVWHIFRVGRRARPIDVRFEATDDGFLAAASHTGYDRLSGHPRHQRLVETNCKRQLIVTDRFTGCHRHVVAGGLLLAPNWRAEHLGDGWIVRDSGVTLRILLQSRGSIRLGISQASYHPEYGLEQLTTRLVWQGELEFPCDVTLTVSPHSSA